MKKTFIFLPLLAAVLCACNGGGISSSSSTSSHVHSFVNEDHSNKYLVSEADCTHAAKYYKSCSCGEKGTETFDYGDPLGHHFNHSGYCDRCQDNFGVSLSGEAIMWDTNNIPVVDGYMFVTLNITKVPEKLYIDATQEQSFDHEPEASVDTPIFSEVKIYESISEGEGVALNMSWYYEPSEEYGYAWGWEAPNTLEKKTYYLVIKVNKSITSKEVLKLFIGAQDLAYADVEFGIEDGHKFEYTGSAIPVPFTLTGVGADPVYTVKYKKTSEGSAAYSTTVPSEIGKYDCWVSIEGREGEYYAGDNIVSYEIVAKKVTYNSADIKPFTFQANKNSFRTSLTSAEVTGIAADDIANMKIVFSRENEIGVGLYTNIINGVDGWTIALADVEGHEGTAARYDIDWENSSASIRIGTTEIAVTQDITSDITSGSGFDTTLEANKHKYFKITIDDVGVYRLAQTTASDTVSMRIMSFDTFQECQTVVSTQKIKQYVLEADTYLVELVNSDGAAVNLKLENKITGDISTEIQSVAGFNYVWEYHNTHYFTFTLSGGSGTYQLSYDNDIDIAPSIINPDEEVSGTPLQYKLTNSKIYIVKVAVGEYEGATACGAVKIAAV